MGEMAGDQFNFYDKDALLFRLHEGLEDTDKPVVFVVGAPFTATHGGVQGVADVAGVIDLIRARFEKRPAQIAALDGLLEGSANRYQTAFDFIGGRGGPDAANKIVKRAVAQALINSGTDQWSERICDLSADQLTELDGSAGVWRMAPAVDAIGQLIAKFPERFGKVVLTSNFDPLLEISIRKHRGSAWKTSLATDGSLFQSQAYGCQVVHIHGYWHGTDTLHTDRQLITERPTLANDLLTLLQDKIVVVMAYGGWPDIFTVALRGVVSNSNLMPEVLWTFHDDAPVMSDYLHGAIAPGLIRNRVSLYKGIDCHAFLPELLALWEDADPAQVRSISKSATPARHETPDGELQKPRRLRLSPLECDRPPNVEVWVGREAELRALETARAQVAIICGIGGEGKSVLAAQYIDRLKEGEDGYGAWDWRDCKEQSDRIRTQIVEVAVRFSEGALAADDLAGVPDNELVEVMLDQTFDARSVIVFDNVDSYVDLENGVFTGVLDRLVQAFASSGSSSRLVLTCRPDVHYTSASIMSFSLAGIAKEEAIELFAKRNSEITVPDEDILEAWRLTNGHAFWLDLLAVQISKVPGTTLRKQLSSLRFGKDNMPDVLSSIWGRLAIREQTLLRLMAEAIRPETEKTIEKFSATQLGYAKFSRAFRALRALNLIVVKQVENAPDLFDLHPLVRQFVRGHFHPTQRAGFIRVVLNQYQAIIGSIGSMLGIHMPFPMLERWSQKVELEVSAGMLDEAFRTLGDAEDALIGGGHAQEYVRVTKLLFEAIDWETAAVKYKLFDATVAVMVAALDQLGERAAADAVLGNYMATIPEKTARYIHYCDIKAYSHWVRKEFASAIEWAGQGVTLKKVTGVDTNYDCEHTLALAKRDGGDPTTALNSFLLGNALEDVMNGGDNPSFNGPMYGNVGRCLQMMGETDKALRCFKHSIRALEDDRTLHSRSNRAYARRWIAEAMESQRDLERAEAFLVDAVRVLGPSAPLRVKDLCKEIDRIWAGNAQVMSESKASRLVSNWMTA